MSRVQRPVSAQLEGGVDAVAEHLVVQLVALVDPQQQRPRHCNTIMVLMSGDPRSIPALPT